LVGAYFFGLFGLYLAQLLQLSSQVGLHIGL